MNLHAQNIVFDLINSALKRKWKSCQHPNIVPNPWDFHSSSEHKLISFWLKSILSFLSLHSHFTDMQLKQKTFFFLQ